jgi:hypothetical protein
MRRLTAACAALVLAGSVTVQPAEAQQRRAPAQSLRQTDGALFIGVTRLDLTELSARLARQGYPALSNDFPQIGFSWSTTRQRVSLGFEFGGGGRPSQVSGDNRYRTEAGAGYALFNVGLLAYSEGGFAVQPKLGVGGGAINLTITDRQATTFDEILARPGRAAHLMAGSLLLDASLGATYRLRATPTQRGTRSLLLGVRGGYTTSLLHGGWHEMRSDAPGGPDAGWGGPHVEFLIGRSVRR